MTRPRPRLPIRPAILALASIVWLASAIGASPARASGCHVDERPVLGSNPSGHLPAWRLSDDRPATPPVLARVPCPGESAHPPVVSTASIGAACLSAIEGNPTTPSNLVLPVEDDDSVRLHRSRLDRPPR